MMNYKEKIRELCSQQTDLNPKAIEYLVDQASQLEVGDTYSHQDVFIDVRSLAQPNQALVIYHKRPQKQPSLYRDDVVGDVADLRDEPGVIRTLETGLASVGLTAMSQEGAVIYQTVFPLVWEKEVVGTLIIEMAPPSLSSSISPTEKPVLDWEQDLPANFLEQLDNQIFVFDPQGTLVYANAKARELYAGRLGYRDQLEGMHYDNLVLDTLSYQEALARARLEKNEIDQVRVPYGGYFFQLKRQLLTNGYLLMECRDVTEIRNLERELQEQKVLVREMNHRVKNNLQTLVSLLRLQAYQTEKKDVKEALEESVHRILSVASIHDLLSHKKGQKLPLAPLLEQVLTTVRRSFGQDFIQVQSQVDADCELDASRATAVALIANEILQNSFKHAFHVKKKNATVGLHLTRKDGIIKLLITDNGSGYNTRRRYSQGHLGLVLVERFVQDKLSGRLDVQSGSKGTRTSILFHE